MTDDKDRAIAQLKELEQEQRDDVAKLRERLDAGQSLRGVPAQIVAAEAKAGAFATAADVVAGVAF